MMQMALIFCDSVFSVLAFCLSAYCVIQIEALKRSTHQISYINPMEQNFDNLNPETINRFHKDDETMETVN